MTPEQLKEVQQLRRAIADYTDVGELEKESKLADALVEGMGYDSDILYVEDWLLDEIIEKDRLDIIYKLKPINGNEQNSKDYPHSI